LKKLFRPRLNYPHELRSRLSTKDPSNYSYGFDEYKDVFVSSFRNMIPNDEYQRISISKSWRYELAMWVKINKKPSLSIEDIILQMDNIVMDKNSESIQKFNKVLELAKIACFTEDCYNLLMWSHYANGHRGVCFEFDINKLDIIDKIFLVIYSATLPDILEFNVTKNSIFHDFYGHIIYHCLHKLNYWNYENEWGLLMISNDFCCPIFIPFIRPTKIIIGAEVKDDFLLKLYELAHSQNIKITKMHINTLGKLEERDNNIYYKN
jgi:hypothetical protein